MAEKTKENIRKALDAIDRYRITDDEVVSISANAYHSDVQIEADAMDRIGFEIRDNRAAKQETLRGRFNERNRKRRPKR